MIEITLKFHETDGDASGTVLDALGGFVVSINDKDYWLIRAHGGGIVVSDWDEDLNEPVGLPQKVVPWDDIDVIEVY